MVQRLIRTLIRWLEHHVADPVVNEPGDMNILVQKTHTDDVSGVSTEDNPPRIRRVISFLGTSQLNETAYFLDEAPHVTVATCFAGYAAYKLLRAEEALFFCTVAADANYQEMQKQHPEFLQRRQIMIADGKTTDEMWQVFAVLTAEVHDGDDLIVDITNSFRSLPVIVLAALAFLQEVRDVRIYRLVYGAFDRDAAMRTAVINLQPFVDLSAWVNATHTLVHYAHGAELADLVRRVTASTQGQWVQIADTLDVLNATLQLVQLTGVSEAAKQLRHQIAALPSNMSPQYIPIKQLLNRVANEYVVFQKAATVSAELQRQQRMIRWYLDHFLYVQAIMLARELLISLVIFRNPPPEVRSQDLMQYINHRRHRTDINLHTAYPACPGEAKGIGKRVTDCRNDLAHPNERWDRRSGINATKQEIIDLCEYVIAIAI